MADWKDTHPNSSSPGSPGLSGAIKDAIGAAVKTFGPSSVTQIAAREQADEAEANGGDKADVVGRMKQAQSTDRDNSYSY